MGRRVEKEMPVSVVVVDGSSVVREVLLEAQQTDEDLRILGAASDFDEALKMVQSCKPDVVAVDLHSPGIDGVAITRTLMETAPLPIVIVASHDPSALGLKPLLESGAAAMITKPGPPGHPEREGRTRLLIDTLKALKGADPFLIKEQHAKAKAAIPGLLPDNGPSLPVCVAIGASTGGPQILKHILDALPADFPIPVLVTQHMSKGFTKGFAQWLSSEARLKVQLGEDGAPIKAGYVYVAPDETHMGLSADGTIMLSTSSREYGMRPAVGYMFRSLEKTIGGNCIAIILTGMGKDGANEMAALHSCGALTIAQDKESCVIYGMPGEAISLGAASEILSPDQIVVRLLDVVEEWKNR